MNRRSIIIAAVIVAVAVGVVALMRQDQPTRSTSSRTPVARTPATSSGQSASTVGHVPAHYDSPPSASSLGLTLPPERFTGMTKEAYQVAREIPETLAQLPCYCHCDESVGHKSLQSCFVDTHAASCATCVGEALTAHQLQKQGLSPSQIRERIIAEYGGE